MQFLSGFPVCCLGSWGLPVSPSSAVPRCHTRKRPRENCGGTIFFRCPIVASWVSHYFSIACVTETVAHQVFLKRERWRNWFCPPTQKNNRLYVCLFYSRLQNSIVLIKNMLKHGTEEGASWPRRVVWHGLCQPQRGFCAVCWCGRVVRDEILQTKVLPASGRWRWRRRPRASFSSWGRHLGAHLFCVRLSRWKPGPFGRATTASLMSLPPWRRCWSPILARRWKDCRWCGTAARCQWRARRGLSSSSDGDRNHVGGRGLSHGCWCWLLAADCGGWRCLATINAAWDCIIWRRLQHQHRGMTWLAADYG